MGIGALAAAFALLPAQIAFQDLGALLARQPAVAARARAYLIASPFGTIHAATFSLPQPVGTAIPHAPVYALADFDPSETAASISRQLLGDPDAPLQFPSVNRADKRDSMISRGRAPMPPMPPTLPVDATPLPHVEAPAAQAAAPLPARADAPPRQDQANLRFDPYSDYEFAAPPDEPQDAQPKQAARVFFGAAPLAAGQEEIKPWAKGQAPVLQGDPDIKLAALTPAGGDAEAKGGESVAEKGVVTGESQRPQSPAERLGLSGATRAKAEQCLANAVYFEARGEPVRGQIAVAQVVMNRVFSPFYPKGVCGVVYQNANRHLACQFTFACDGVPDVVTEPDAWLRAKRIARDMLDGKLWMPEVAKATHYHAYWVHPDWVAEMHKIYKLGVHTFYRPRAWGSGANEPSWSDPNTTAKETKLIDKM